MDEGVFASRVWDLVHQMDLGSHWQKSWTSLSLGMIKKAGLVGVFLPDADLRILDEPFAGGVDPLGMEALYRWMIQSRARGETIVFSTQVLEQAGAICDRILLLEKGSLRWLGAPDDLVKEAGLDPDEPRAFARAFASICSGNPEVRAGTEVWR
jgi:ABC-2 type transport system ATP-binding protein